MRLKTLTRLKEFGEDAVIEELSRRFRRASPRVIKAIGDDAAVTVVKKGALLATTDSLIEGIHFKRSWTPPYFLGRKSLAVSLSDMAAMGGSPVFFLLSIAFPSSTTLKFLDSFLDGVKDCAREFSVTLIGGNTSEAPSIMTCTTVLGEGQKGKILYRNGAMPGDVIYVTGTIGDSILGLNALKKKGLEALKKGHFKNSALKHLNPAPRVKAGSLIAKRNLASSMIDLSDGLVCDLMHIMEQSHAGARLYREKLPISRELKDYLKKHPKDNAMPLAGGEDYELLFTSRPENITQVQRLSMELGLAITAIGEMLGRGKGLTVAGKDGKITAVKKQGYEHFRS